VAVVTKRVRRSPEVARAEILEAAESLLRDQDWTALTVESVMERTGMTRSSFYHYFKTMDDLSLALFARVEAEISGAVDDWLDHGVQEDPELATVSRLSRMFDVWKEHAGLMRALEHGAGRGATAYGQWRGRVVDGYIEKTTHFIEREVAQGRSDASDPRGLATALILMNVSVATDQALRRAPFSAERLGAVAARVWNAAIYGRTGEAGGQAASRPTVDKV
jgi:AcrR family transcriptional regulator